MRYTEFLLEYDRSREQHRIELSPRYQARLKQDPEFSLEKLESADPTTQKVYVPRLAQWWLMGAPVEDLISTVADALDKYHKLKLKKKLDTKDADIGRFGTAGQFLDVVVKYQLPEEEKPEDRGKFKELYRDAQLIVVELLDKTAAQWWGQNTQWCTAAKKNNMFSNYHKRGPLYVIIPRQEPGVKYQLWWNRRDPYDLQFMDVQDQSVDPRWLAVFPRLQQIFGPLHKHIQWNPKPSVQDQLAAVRQHSGAIEYIPNPGPEVQLAAVRQDGWVIRRIKNPGPEVQLAAVRQNDDAIRWIKNPSPEVQLAAVSQNGYAIRHITNPSTQVQLAAVRQSGGAIEDIPNPGPDLQLAAVQQYGPAIQYIKNPSTELQLAAIQQNSDAIQYIKNPSTQVQLAAVQQYGHAIRHIANPGPDLQLAAVQQNGGAIRWIKNPSTQVQLAAVRDYGPAIVWITNPDPEVQLAAVRQNSGAIHAIPNPAPEVLELYQKLTGKKYRRSS